MNNEGTGHIDMQAKIISDTTILVGEYGDEDATNKLFLNQTRGVAVGAPGDGSPYRDTLFCLQAGAKGPWFYSVHTHRQNPLFFRRASAQLFVIATLPRRTSGSTPVFL